MSESSTSVSFQCYLKNKALHYFEMENKATIPLTRQQKEESKIGSGKSNGKTTKQEKGPSVNKESVKGLLKNQNGNLSTVVKNKAVNPSKKDNHSMKKKGEYTSSKMNIHEEPVRTKIKQIMKMKRAQLSIDNSRGSMIRTGSVHER